MPLITSTGEVVQNMDLVRKIEALGTPAGVPTKKVKIARSGTL